MAVVELSVLAVLAAVQTCERGTVGQEDRTPRELRLESGQPGSREGSARQAGREIRVGAGELWSSGGELGERISSQITKSHGLVKYTPLFRRQSAIKINNVGNLIARQDFILGIVSVKHPNMISKQV